jgi:hypothetical protein
MMQRAMRAAAESRRRIATLDARAGDMAESFYRSLGWREAGAHLGDFDEHERQLFRHGGILQADRSHR